MPRPKQADEANYLAHALNRGSARNVIFKKDDNCMALQRISVEGQQRSPGHSCISTNEQPLAFGMRLNQGSGMSNFLQYVTLTHTQSYTDQYEMSGEGMSIQVASSVFQSKMISIFVVARYWEGTRCVQVWQLEPKNGDGDHFIGG